MSGTYAKLHYKLILYQDTERQRQLEEALVHRKRSSRIAIKESEKEEAELAAKKKAEENEKMSRARRLEARQQKEEAERERRESAREQRRKEREQRELQPRHALKRQRDARYFNTSSWRLSSADYIHSLLVLRWLSMSPEIILVVRSLT